MLVTARVPVDIATSGNGVAPPTADSPHHPDPASVPPAAVAVAGHEHNRRADARNTVCVRVPFPFGQASPSLARLLLSKSLHTPTVQVRTCGIPVEDANTNITGHGYFHPASVTALSTPTPAATVPSLELALPSWRPTRTTHHRSLPGPGDERALPRRP